MKFVLSLVVVLSLALVSQAAIVSTQNGISVDVSIDSVTPATGGLTAYIVSLSSASGIYGIDGRIDAVAGKMNQVWAFGGAFNTPVQDATGGWGFLTPADKANDTNIMIPSASQTVVRAAAEDLAGTYLAGSPTTTMAFGLSAGPTSVGFARVVLGAADNAHVALGVTNGVQALANFSFDVVPEPMTLSLVAAGALALIRRRR